MIPALLIYLKAQVTSVSNRVYATVAPDVSPPYVVYFQVSGLRDYTHGGFSGLSRPRMQFSCYASTYKAAKDVAQEVIDALEGWTGAQACFIQNEIDSYEEDTKLYKTMVDCFIWHS